MTTDFRSYNFNYSTAAKNLKDFSEYADCIECINQSEYGDGQLEGEWFYNDDDTLTIYYGSFGNDNSPGASDYTHAVVYDLREEYDAAVAEWEACPEYLDSEEEG